MKRSSDLLGKTLEKWGSGAGLPSGTPLASLPCLSWYNSIIKDSKKKKNRGFLSWNDRKRQLNFMYSIEQFIEKSGTNNCLFFTFTVAPNITDHKEYSKLWNSLLTNEIRPRFGADWGIAVDERQERGAWHTHFIPNWGCDVRTGYDFRDGFKKRSANKNLREAWQWLNRVKEAYHFGPRCSAEPIKSNAKGMACYCAKYLSKGILERTELDYKQDYVKGKLCKIKIRQRLVKYGKGCKLIDPFVLEIKANWAGRVVEFSKKFGFETVGEFIEEVKAPLGTHWGRYVRNSIANQQYIDFDNYTWDDFCIEMKMLKDGNENLGDAQQRSLAASVIHDNNVIRASKALSGVSNPAADSPPQKSVKATPKAPYEQLKLKL
jgi:hypothetical protein